LKVVVVKAARTQSGFTLIEMLAVIAILGILAGLAVPALKDLGKSNSSISASRQLLDDVGRARQLAMANRTTVYMVFVPANFWTGLPASAALTNLADKQLTGYTFVSYGNVGDQPGRHIWHYLAPWQNLPEGTFIVTNKFALPDQPCFTNSFFNPGGSPVIYGFVTNSIPFPLETSSSVTVPCVVFDSSGHLLGQGGQISSWHEYIPLAKGAVLPAIDTVTGTRAYIMSPPQVSETPPGNSAGISYNIVDIDPLTGRATLQFQKIP
jgi:prepilin-type N-terminal cleavage/methylation domain-containing protein